MEQKSFICVSKNIKQKSKINSFDILTRPDTFQVVLKVSILSIIILESFFISHKTTIISLSGHIVPVAIEKYLIFPYQCCSQIRNSCTWSKFFVLVFKNIFNNIVPQSWLSCTLLYFLNNLMHFFTLLLCQRIPLFVFKIVIEY